jgi:hypothetical protein
MNPFQSIAEDIRWLHNHWWNASFEGVSEPDIRRGSTTLRLLLVDDMLQRAWRAYHFPDQPIVRGPDLKALGNRAGHHLQYAIAVVAGGGRRCGVETSLVGAFRVDNLETGVPAGAEVGFAVRVTAIMRKASEPREVSELTPLVQKAWRLKEYLDAPGAAMHGKLATDPSITFSRRDIIQYFANYAGGAHLGRVDKVPRGKRLLYEHLAKLQGKVDAISLDGLHFELFSIGQAIGKSEDVAKLVRAIDKGPP